MKLSFTIIGLFICCWLNAQKAGTLDSSFGANGLVLKNFSEPLSALFYKGLVLPDDKILEVGSIGAAFGAVRYNADGSADSGFGKDGVALIDFPKLSSVAYNVAQQSDGKLLLTGSGIQGFMESAIYHGLIVRLKQDGSVDSSFGVKGIIERTTPHRYTAGFGAIAILLDKSFIVYGNSDGLTYINKFTKDGILDESFGENGYVYLNFNYGIRTCKIQPDGKIVLAGSYYYGGLQQFYLQRLLPDGAADESFGTNGLVTTITYPVEDILYDMAFQSDGKIVVTGTENYYSVITSRYTIDGKLDSSFGINGASNIKLLNMATEGKAIAIAKDDKIVLGGATGSGDLFVADNVVIRLTSDGSIDSSFGNSGITITDFGDGFGDQVISMGLQKSGKLITIGSTTSNIDYYSSVARYNNDERSKKQIIINKIKHYIGTHNAQATSFNTVSIYPNPAQNVLHVSGLSSNKSTLTVIDFMGNVKLQTVANASSYNLNIAALTPGNYLLKIEINDAIATKKFVKE